MKPKRISVDVDPNNIPLLRDWARRAGLNDVGTLMGALLQGEFNSKLPEPDIALQTKYERILGLKPRPQDVHIGYFEGKYLGLLSLLWHTRKAIRSRWEKWITRT